MTPTITPSVTSNSSRHRRRGARPAQQRRVLGRYSDWDGRPREVIARNGSAGTMLVVDRDACTLGDRRLLAHLGADEPPANAALVCRSYLEQARRGRCRCRALTAQDMHEVPFAVEEELGLQLPAGSEDQELLDGEGRCYRLELVGTGMSIPALRWRRHAAPGGGGAPAVVSVREVIARLESYEPVRSLTTRALMLQTRAETRAEIVSTTVLRAEIERVRESPIVLNRGLREAVLQRIEREGLSMSEIAIRCGRIKRDGSGNVSGETSWLARRLGMLAEAGRSAPTPWIHSDVLALIARSGLAISPREVEL